MDKKSLAGNRQKTAVQTASAEFRVGTARRKAGKIQFPDNGIPRKIVLDRVISWAHVWTMIPERQEDKQRYRREEMLDRSRSRGECD